MPGTAQQLLKRIRQCELVTDKQLSELQGTKVESASSRDLASQLVKRGYVTAWQIERIATGQPLSVGRYVLLDRLGEGGMGTVYKARCRKSGQIVAIKVMSSSLTNNRQSIERFLREVRAAGKLKHPNIVTALDAGRVDDTHFLIMEYVAGRDVNEWLKDHATLPVAWSCECARQIALGLQHAHELRIVHRDIKPSNILIVGKSFEDPLVAKILDMGLVRFESDSESNGDETELTQSNQILGTPDYIAPEQAMNTRRSDIRSDIFSLGCTLFKMLTGEVPFSGSNAMEKLMARASREAPPPSQLRPELPAELDELVGRMLALDPDERFQTPQQVAHALLPFAMDHHKSSEEADTIAFSEDDSELDVLMQVVESEREKRVASPASVEPPGGESTNGKSARVSVIVSCTIGLVAILACVAFTLWFVTTDSSPTLQPGPVAEIVDHIESSKRVETPNRLDKTTQRQTARASTVSVPSVIPAVIIQTPEELPTQPTSPEPPAITTAPTPRESVPPAARAAPNTQPAAVTEPVRRFIGHADAVHSVAFMPGRQAVVSAGRDKVIRVWDVDSAIELKTLEGHNDWIMSVHVLNEGRGLLTAGWDRTVRLWDVMAATEVRQWTHAFAPYMSLDVSQDGRRFLAGTWSGNLELGDLESEGPAKQLVGHAGAVKAVAFCSGNQIISGDWGMTVCQWNMNRTEPVRRLPGHTDRVMCAAGLPHSRQALTGSRDGTIRLWNLDRGTESRQFSGHSGEVLSITVKPDGKQFASSGRDGTIRLWDLATGDEVQRFVGHDAPVWSVAMSPDGEWLLSGGHDKSVLLWELAQ